MECLQVSNNEDDEYCLGFKNAQPVLLTKLKPLNMNMCLQQIQSVPNTGQKFINLNGKKLKIIAMPLSVQNDLKLKQTLTQVIKPNGAVATTATQLNNSKNPLVFSESQTSEAVQKNFLKTITTKSVVTNVNNINKDKTNVIPCQTQIRMLSSKAASTVPVCKVFQPIPKEEIIKIKKPRKLVEKSMQTTVKKFTDKPSQTDKKFVDRVTQTDNYYHDINVSQIDLDDIGDSVVLNNVNFGVGPTIEPYRIMHPNSSIASTKKMRFFLDLKEAVLVNKNGNLPIHEAVIQNDGRQVKRWSVVLKARKSGVNLENNNGCTPLQLAIMYDANLEIVNILLEHGADLSSIDEEGNNLIHLAVIYDRVNLLEVLLDYALITGLSIDQFNYEGQTPLILAVSNGFRECAKLLLHDKYKIDVNLYEQKAGRTALFLAAERCDFELVKLLLAHSADTKMKNYFGTSTHDAMYEVEDIPQEIKQLILSKGKRKSSDTMEKNERNKRFLKTYPKHRKINKVEYEAQFKNLREN